MLPLHDQLHGPEPDTDEAEPDEHKLLDGADATVVPFALPQEPLTGVGVLLALQLALPPPLLPLHDQLHGPEPDTDEAEPDEHKLLDGADATVVPFALPQEPLEGAGAVEHLVEEQLASLPLPDPRHIQL